MPATMLSFRPDASTMHSLDSIAAITGVRDRSTVLREAIRVYEEQLLLSRMVAACAQYADESAAMAESFGAADASLDA